MRDVLLGAIGFFDPRGRINRLGLLAVALVLLVLEIAAGACVVAAGLAIDGPVVIALKVAFLWIATAAISRRLHDLDRSAWAIAKAAAIIVLWSLIATLVLMVALGAPAMAEGQPGFWASVAATTVPVLAMILWLHCAPGTAGPNRYGDVPSGWGLVLSPQHA